MSSEEAGQTITVTTEAAEPAAAGPAALKGNWMCPIGDHHNHPNDYRKVWKECQEESFWYRALPFSVAGMTFTGILIYNGIWKSSKRFGPFPKLIGAGIFGFALGKASYAGKCRRKFQQLGFEPDCYGKDHDHRLSLSALYVRGSVSPYVNRNRTAIPLLYKRTGMETVM